jgi:hypothetical protein
MLLGQFIADSLMGPSQDHGWNVLHALCWAVASIVAGSTACSRLFDGTYRFASETTRTRIRVMAGSVLALAFANIWIDILSYYLKKSGIPHWRAAWIVLAIPVFCGEYYCYRKIKQLVSDFAQPTASASQHV